MFWDYFVISFHQNKNPRQLQMNVTLTLRVNHYKFCVFLYFIFYIDLLYLLKNKIGVF